MLTSLRHIKPIKIKYKICLGIYMIKNHCIALKMQSANQNGATESGA